MPAILTLLPLILILPLQLLAYKRFMIAYHSYADSLEGTEDLELKVFSIPRGIWTDLPERRRIFQDSELLSRYIVTESDAIPKSHFVLPQIDLDVSENTLTSITKAINEYLESNQGAQPDYQLIKDICDRTLEKNEEAMNSWIPAPLYMGLAGTMIGIIIALVHLIGTGSYDNSTWMDSLFWGISTAMVASVAGLVLTTVFSVHYASNARHQVEQHKFAFLTFIQVKLLPAMSRADTSGIAGLTNQLSTFNSKAGDYVSRMEIAMMTGSKIMENETLVLQELQGMDIRQLSKNNLAIFKELSKLMTNFDEFKHFFEHLTGNLTEMQKVSSSLSGLLERTGQFASALELISETAQENKTASRFINTHFEQIEQYKALYSELIGTTSDSIKQNTNALIERTKEHQDGNQQALIKISDTINKTLQEVTAGVQKVTEKSLQELESAFHERTPDFSKLDHLTELEHIKTGVSNMNSAINTSSQSQLNALLNKLDEIRKALEKEKTIPSPIVSPPIESTQADSQIFERKMFWILITSLGLVAAGLFKEEIAEFISWTISLFNP